jgi:hypothetical protein
MLECWIYRKPLPERGVETVEDLEGDLGDLRRHEPPTTMMIVSTPAVATLTPLNSAGWERSTPVHRRGRRRAGGRRNCYCRRWHEPGTMTEFGFNKKAYEALPVDLQRTLDHAAAATQVYGLADFHAKNAIALERLRTEFKGTVEILQFPAPVLRDLKKLAAEVVREQSEKTPMARKVHASFTKFQAQLAGWSRVSEGAYHQSVAL